MSEPKKSKSKKSVAKSLTFDFHFIMAEKRTKPKATETHRILSGLSVVNFFHFATESVNSKIF